MPAPLVGRAPRYRTLDGKTVVGIEDTHFCGDCNGRGSKWLRWPTVKPCQTCHGSGRLLGRDPHVWPVAVIELTREEEAAFGRPTPEALRREQPERRPPLPPAA